MLLILDVVSGPVAGRRIEVRAGTVLRIGRTTKADYAIGGDFYLSGEHFAVECDGAECRVRDLGSSNGTFVNGARVMDAVVVRHGDALAAGGSTFAVRLEAPDHGSQAPSQAMPPSMGQPVALPPPTSAMQSVAQPMAQPVAQPMGQPLAQPVAQPMGTPPPLPGAAAASAPAVNHDATLYSPSRDPGAAGSVVLPAADAGHRWPGFTRSESVLLNALFRENETLFAVLDAARDSRIPSLIDASGEQFALVDATGRTPLYIVAVPPQSRLLDPLIKDGWGRGWGFFATARVDLEMVCGHLRSYLVLRNQDGRSLTFHFWDPRVLRAVVPAMTPREALDFFGPVCRLITESERAELAVEFVISGRGARQQALALV